MPFEIHANPVEQRFDVHYRGAVSAAERRRAFEQVIAQARESGIDRILVDFTAAHATRDDFESCNRLAALLAREAKRVEARVAYVVRNAGSMNADVSVLAKARDMPARCFRDRASAIAWLQGDPE